MLLVRTIKTAEEKSESEKTIHCDFFLTLVSMKINIRKTSHEEAEKEKRAAWMAMSPMERLAWHDQMLRRIYGIRYNAPLTDEDRKIRIIRG
jgi:hypothetical protein